METIFALIDPQQIINSVIGSLLVAALLAFVIPTVWQIFKMIKATHFWATCGAGFRAIVSLLPLALLACGAVWVLIWMGENRTSFLVSCQGECSQSDHRLIKQCLYESRRGGGLRRKNTFDVIVDFKTCVSVEGFSLVRCKPGEDGCITFRLFP